MTSVSAADRLAELREFAVLHARGQGVEPRRVEQVLARITNDEPGNSRSWARVWTERGDRVRAEDGPLAAAPYYAVARFPHHGDDDRRAAQAKVVAAFEEWRGSRGIERLSLPHPDGTVHAWAAGLDRDRPLLLVMGGIVSVKEQWAPTLPIWAKMGYAAVVCEMPGVGENPLRYGTDSYRLFPWLMDTLADRARVGSTTTLALSFSGHMALRAAAEDDRIARVLTVGAPVSRLFTDQAWWTGQVPGITKDTLVALSGLATREDVFAALAPQALTPAQLGRIRATLHYVVSERDEIIPGSEAELLERHVARARFKRFDDVHGSPAHLAQLRRWILGGLVAGRLAARR